MGVCRLWDAGRRVPFAAARVASVQVRGKAEGSMYKEKGGEGRLERGGGACVWEHLESC